MATKAGMFRYLSERAGLSEKLRREMAGETDDVVRPPEIIEAGETRLPRKALYQLEHSERRPSRKSTRKSAQHQRTDSHFWGRRLAHARPHG